MSNLSTTSDQILQSAQTLIVAGGYNGFSYADIAAVVGIRKASIHHHFPSKADLVRTLVARYREDAAAGLARLEQSVTDPLEQVRAYLAYWEACLLDNTAPFCVCAMLAGEAQLLPEDVHREVKAHFRSLSAWLARVMERGAKDGVLSLRSPPAVEAEALLATVHGAMLSARAYGSPEIFSTVKDALLQRLAREN
ncbi:TetR/AcrR family transcriptional regulator [Rhizobium glycinendophyticum]|uniref:TetR/AcrR family transcriptional regulator n=1 Tax=Rhizobium glycinendophyticum TaxID=2589807 RepID=A0A504UB85_9HYPH|nr:TetR/AcrR family transcriptional regulator [Rhizobium glycinendophyticum]TPP11749.1 TetR/AcrR family transcriptional regulator [Rhizobium glycinendophyticum]